MIILKKIKKCCYNKVILSDNTSIEIEPGLVNIIRKRENIAYYNVKNKKITYVDNSTINNNKIYQII